jgi:hypothetical protein
MAMGTIIGAIIGALTDNVGIWIATGIAVGTAIGSVMAMKESKDWTHTNPDKLKRRPGLTGTPFYSLWFTTRTG